MCGLINILQVDRRRFRRLPYRLAPFLSFVSQQPMPYHMIDHRRVTLSSARVQEAIKECACESVSQEVASDPVALRCAERKHQRRAAGIIGAMSSAVYRPLVRLVGWLFFWTFGKLFGRLDIQQSHMAMLLHAQKEGIPMVFLPNHKSHMDYLILTFVLFSLGVKTPRVAAGDNLRLPFVSWLVTHLGGFFIKRKLDSSVHKDVLYRKCLQEYMERCLYAGENLEFFLEGSRSRSGKPCSPKAGLLSVVVDAVKQGVVEDVLLVPVNISYDKILERSFVKDELMGGVKKPETVMQAVRGAWSILTRKVGAVRVDISQPFSLQEYLSKAVVSEGSLLELSHSSLRGSGASLAQLSHRRLITALSYHIMYDITQCTSLTPTGMVAFLLLNKYREQGATVDELVASYLQLEKLAETRGRVISSFLGAGEAVHCALHHICHLITVDSAPCEQNLSGLVASSNQKVRPRLELPDIFDLYHLSNQVSPLVAMQAIVARSILSVAKEVKRNKKNIKREKVIQSASFLARMMAREFIVTPPCEELTLALQEEVDNFVNSEILKIVGPSYHGNRNRDLDLDEEDWYEHVPDVEYELDSQAGGWGQLALISSVLEPLLEGYWLVATQLLLSLPHGSGPLLTGESSLPCPLLPVTAGLSAEAELVSQYQQVTTAKAHKGLLARGEWWEGQPDTAGHLSSLYSGELFDRHTQKCSEGSSRP
jgi:glycerol-3-phosphate O-acyltransferase 1/2